MIFLKIERLDDKDRHVVIEPPPEDVPTLCLEFAADFSALLIERLTPHVGCDDLKGSRFTEDQYDAMANARALPEDIRLMLQEDRDKRVAEILSSTADPIAAAVQELSKVNVYASGKLEEAGRNHEL